MSADGDTVRKSIKSMPGGRSEQVALAALARLEAAEAERGRLALEAATADQDWKRAEAQRDALAEALLRVLSWIAIVTRPIEDGGPANDEVCRVDARDLYYLDQVGKRARAALAEAGLE